MSRSMLEKALIHLLNEEQDKAERIFHQFIVAKARQIHESLRTGDESVLAEGWDDEIASEEYFSEADLADAEDETGDALPDADPMSAPTADATASTDADMSAADAADDLTADLGGDAAMDGEDMGSDDMGGDMGGDADLSADVADIKDQLEKLTAEFEQMMASLDVDGDGDHDETDHDMGGDDVAAGAEETTDDFDFGGDDAGSEDEADAGDETASDDDAEGGKDDGDEDEKKVDESFDDITESVLAELEKVSATLSDGKEVGAGKAVSQNTNSPIPQKGVNSRQGAKPVFTKAEEHKGFERETAPTVKDLPKRKNTRSTAEQGNHPVKAPAAKKEGSLAADGSSVKVDPKMTAAPPQAKSVR